MHLKIARVSIVLLRRRLPALSSAQCNSTLRWETQMRVTRLSAQRKSLQMSRGGYRALPCFTNIPAENARINYIRFDLVEGGRKRSGRRDVRYAVRVDFSFLIDILGKVNQKGFRIKQALIQRNLL